MSLHPDHSNKQPEENIGANRQYIESQSNGQARALAAAIISDRVLDANGYKGKLVPKGELPILFAKVEKEVHHFLRDEEAMGVVRREAERLESARLDGIVAAMKTERAQTAQAAPVERSREKTPAAQPLAFKSGKAKTSIGVPKWAVEAAAGIALFGALGAAGAKPANAQTFDQMQAQNDAVIQRMHQNGCDASALGHGSKGRMTAGAIAGGLAGLSTGRAGNIWRGATAGAANEAAQEAQRAQQTANTCRQIDIQMEQQIKQGAINRSEAVKNAVNQMAVDVVHNRQQIMSACMAGYNDLENSYIQTNAQLRKMGRPLLPPQDEPNMGMMGPTCVQLVSGYGNSTPGGLGGMGEPGIRTASGPASYQAPGGAYGVSAAGQQGPGADPQACQERYDGLLKAGIDNHESVRAAASDAAAAIGAACRQAIGVDGNSQQSSVSSSGTTVVASNRSNGRQRN